VGPEWPRSQHDQTSVRTKTVADPSKPTKAGSGIEAPPSASQTTAGRNLPSRVGFGAGTCLISTATFKVPHLFNHELIG
jgi:hypothetical protein